MMKVKAQGVFPSGALRAPRFLSTNLDSLEGGEKVAFSAMRNELEKISLSKWEALARAGRLSQKAIRRISPSGLPHKKETLQALRSRMTRHAPLTPAEQRKELLLARNEMRTTPQVMSSGGRFTGVTVGATIGGRSPMGMLRKYLVKRQPMSVQAIGPELAKGPIRAGTILAPEPGRKALRAAGFRRDYPSGYRGVLSHEVAERELSKIKGQRALIPATSVMGKFQQTGVHMGGRPILSEMQHMTKDPAMHKHWERIRGLTGEGISMKKWREHGGTPYRPLPTKGRAERVFEKAIRPEYGRMAGELIKKKPFALGVMSRLGRSRPEGVPHLTVREAVSGLARAGGKLVRSATEPVRRLIRKFTESGGSRMTKVEKSKALKTLRKRLRE
jgi:hypothetical protein